MEFNITLVPDDNESERTTCSTCTWTASLVQYFTDVQRARLQIRLVEEGPERPIQSELSCMNHAGDVAAKMIQEWTNQHIRRLQDNQGPNRKEDKDTAAPFLIEVKPGDLDRVEESLRRQDIRFDKVGSMVCNDPGMYAQIIFTGESAPEAIGPVNKWLEEQNRPERIRIEFEEMDPLARRDFLKLINLHSCWNADWSTGGERKLAGIDQESWERFAASHIQE